MIRFQNPYFKTPTQLKVAQHAPAVVAWLQSQSSNRVITLAELRAGLPDIAGDLSRAVVNQICQDIGAEIENQEDDQA